MNCDGLPVTGGLPLVLLVLAAAWLGTGVLLWSWSHARRLGPGAVVGLITIGAGLVLVGGAPSPAQAGTTDCTHPGTGNSLTITQTSTMAGLAPGVAPAAITGRVVNNGPDGTFVGFVTVSIVTVTKAPGAQGGSCDTRDYLIQSPRMPVGRTLGAGGGSATFAGASIGFSHTTAKQDACKSATVGLRYDAS